MFDFTGKTVLVSGGTSGIGRQTALAFSLAGANVVVSGLRTEEPIPPGIRMEIVDLSDAAAIEALIASLPELHVLVNAAGMIRREAEYEMDVFQQVIDVNLVGAMRMSSAARSKLASSHGCIVNFASMYSFFGAGRAPSYSASKGGVSQLTKSLAVAWAPEGIRVNAVAPGWIATSLTAALREDTARSAAILARTPFGRWGLPEDISGPVMFLASGAAAFVTGVILPVDGGYSAA